MEWSCHICKETRPDAMISVISKPLVMAGKVCGEQNIRFCNDKIECRQGAVDFDFMS